MFAKFLPLTSVGRLMRPALKVQSPGRHKRERVPTHVEGTSLSFFWASRRSGRNVTEHSGTRKPASPQAQVTPFQPLLSASRASIRSSLKT